MMVAAWRYLVSGRKHGSLGCLAVNEREQPCFIADGLVKEQSVSGEDTLRYG